MGNDFKRDIRYDLEGQDDPGRKPRSSELPRQQDPKGRVLDLPLQQDPRRRSRTSDSRTRGYTAPRGTMNNVRKKAVKGKRKLKMRAASLLLATAIGIGGITLVSTLNKHNEPEYNITQIQEMGNNPQNMGLSPETVEKFEQYDEYFENFDNDSKYNLTDEKVLEMIADIRDLHFSVVKEKVGDLKGVDAKDITMYYSFIKGDGKYYSSVVLHEDEYGKEETFSNSSSGLFGIGKKNYLPEEITNIITQLESLNSLSKELKLDKISKVNAIKKLEKLYDNVGTLASSQLMIDEKGNITVIPFQIENKEKEDSQER